MVPTLAGKAIQSASVDIPSCGRWIARVTLDGEHVLAGQVSMELVSGTTWTGTVASGEGYNGSTVLTVVGGRNGLHTMLPPKSFLATPMSSIIAETLSDVGETLQDDSGGLLSKVSSHVVRSRMSAISWLNIVCSDLDVPWQATFDSKIRVGAIPTTQVKWRYEVTDRQPYLDKIEIASDEGLAVPGNVIADLTVVRANHRLTASSLRSTLWGSFDLG